MDFSDLVRIKLPCSIRQYRFHYERLSFTNLPKIIKFQKQVIKYVEQNHDKIQANLPLLLEFVGVLHQWIYNFNKTFNI